MRIHDKLKFSRGLLVGLALTCSAALGVALLSTGMEPVLDGRAAVPALRWEAGGELGYEFRAAADLQLRMDGEGTAQAVQSLVDATLRLRVFEVGADGAALGVRFDRVRRTTNGQQDEAADQRLATPFVVRVATDGRFAAFEFPPSLAGEDRRQLAEWLRTFEIVLTADARERWASEQTHEVGTYVARCEWTGSRVERRKHRYQDLGDGRRVQIGESVLRADLAAEGSWLEGAELRERLSVREQGQVSVEVLTTASLRRIPARAGVLIADTAQAFIAGGEARLAVLQAPAEPEPATEAERAEFQALLLGLADLRRVDPAVLHALRDMLRAHPELGAIVHELMRTNRLRELGAGIALHALELAGNHGTRATLAAIAADPVVVGQDRLRALVAIGGAGAADAEVRAQLWRLHADQGDPAARERAATALLALGSIGRSLRQERREDYGALRAELALALQAAPEPGAVSAALAAIANTGDPALAPAVAARIGVGSPVERAQAARALGGLGDRHALACLSERLQVEQDGAVRAEVVSSLAALGDADPRNCDSIEQRIVGEADAVCRLAMARYLAPQVDRRPGLRATLSDVLARESDQRVQKLLGATLAGMPWR